MNPSTSHSTHMLPPAIQLRLFGAPAIQIENKPIGSIPAKAKALLAYLAVTRQSQSRTTLAALLWDGMAENKALANLRKVIQQLRIAMPEHFSADRHVVTLSTDINIWVDVLAFEDELNHALSIADTDALEQALHYYSEDFLAGFFVRKAPDFEAWQRAQQARLREMMINSLKKLSEIYIANQELPHAIDIAQRILIHEPWREEAHRHLMRLYHQTGETQQALLQYEICSQLLEKELGVPPSAATEALYKEMRSGKAAPTQLDPNTLQESDQPSGFEIPYRLIARVDLRADKQLFGIQSAHSKIKAALLTQARPWLVAIDGIGGIGKTALAQILVNELSHASYFEEMAWVSAKQEEFKPNEGTQPTEGAVLDAEQLIDSILAQLATAKQLTSISSSAAKETLLQRLLDQKPTLIVVDNLETVADYEALLPTLRNLANPSKFLITSRYSLAHYPDVFAQTLGELSQNDVFDLLRHEAAVRGIRGLEKVEDETLAKIYAIVGGHPLTLNLILGQLNFLPLDRLLGGLQHTSNKRTEDLYTYIYRQTWQLLDPPSQQLFCTMPLLHNATYAQLCAITQLPEQTIQAALAQLINLSLIRVDGDLFDPRYALHRLTETFITTEVQAAADQYLLGDPQTWRDFYQQTVSNGLHYWHNHPIVQEVDVQQLDHNRESILNLLSYGLTQEMAWSHLRALIYALSSYMERRGHWRAWRTILESAIETAQNANDIDGETTITALLGRLSQRQGRDKELVRHYRRSITLARQQNNRYEIGRACCNLGYFYIDSGQWWRAEVLSLRALQIFEELENDHGIAHTTSHMGMLHTRQKQWASAEEYLQKACQLWRDHNDQQALISGYINLGVLYVEMGKTTQAMENLHRAHRITQRTGELSNTARILNNMAVAHHKDKAWREAEECAKKAESLFHEYADQRGLASVWQNLGEIYADINQKTSAIEYFDSALTIHRKLNNRSEIEHIRAQMNKL